MELYNIHKPVNVIYKHFLSYQWHSAAGDEWTAISGATAASHTPSTGAAGAAVYYVRVTNTNNNATGKKTAGINSATATVTVTASSAPIVNALPPAISVQPQDAAYAVGETATALFVTAASPDGGVLSYQWHISTGNEWTAISGATGPSHTPSTEAAGAAAYYVKITNTNNNVTGTKTAGINSATATVTASSAPVVNAQAPVISVQPLTAAYTVGGTAKALSVTAASPDGGTLGYQWHSASSGGEWTAISGATAASYTPPAATAGIVSYYVKVTNTNNNVTGTKTASVNSATAIITVNPAPVVNAQAPVISVQPVAASYTVGGTAKALSVTAASPDGGTLGYQWHSATSGGEWTAISGATGPSYTPPTAAAGIASYYAKVTNTNNDVNGTKTASANSEPATITVTAVIVNAKAPTISAQPQNGAYTIGAPPTPLSVTAASPDGGVLSYQWHSRTGGEWTAIDGATAASYTPPTAAAEVVYYYVKVTNTNNNLSGTKTATVNSEPATVTVATTTPKTGFVFSTWVNEDNELISDMPDNFDIGFGDILALEAADELTNIQWSINNTDLPAPRGTARSIAIEAANYAVGTYTLGLRATRDNKPYSINITFTVDN
jgi:hypothetical protein